MSNELWVFLTKEHKFRINSKLTTHCSLLKNVWKTWTWIAGGFQALGFLRTHNKGRLQRRGTATWIFQMTFVQCSTLKTVAVPRLPDALSLSCQLFHGFKNPRLFALTGFASSRRLWAMSCECFWQKNISIELGRPKMDVEITDFPSEKKYL